MAILTDDINLWRAFKKGNQQAFGSIYHNYYHGLYQYAFKLTQSQTVAEDCLQDLFIHLWSNRKNLSDISHIKPYLFKSLRRDLNRINCAASYKKDKETFLLQLPAAPIFSPEDFVVEDETLHYVQAQIARTLNRLPARQREAVYLKYYEELEYKEIAQIMGIHYQSVINLLFKAMTHLKKEKSLHKLSALLYTLPFMLGVVQFGFS